MADLIMSREQTAVYDGGNDSEARALLSLLHRQAAEQYPTETVTIYTHDGIVADYRPCN